MLPLLGGCIECYPQLALTQVSVLKSEVLALELPGTLVTKMRCDSFKSALAEARRPGPRSYVACPVTPERSPGGRRRERNSSRQQHQTTPGRFPAKQTVETAAKDFPKCGFWELKNGTSPFCRIISENIKVPCVDGVNEFQAATDLCMTRLGTPLMLQVSPNFIVCALKQHGGVCYCGGRDGCGLECVDSGIKKRVGAARKVHSQQC